MTKALVIEAKGSIQKQIANTLKNQGIAVELVTRPERAADRVLASMPDLVLVDIHLPNVDLLQLAQQIQRHAPGVPIILLTSRPTRLRSEVARLGATVLRTHPFKPSEFIGHIKAVIRDRHMGPPAEVPSPLSQSLTAHLLLDLNDPTTGRLDAKRIANYLSISLSSLASAIGKSDATVHKTPAAASLQEALAPIARSLAILSRLLRSQDRVLGWLNSPHPDLGGHTPLNLTLNGKATAVAEMLEAALAGQPS